MSQEPAREPPPAPRPQETLLRRWRRLDSWIDARFGGADVGLDDAMAHRFKSDAAAIEDAPVPLSAHAALYGVLVLMVIAILWAVFGRVDRIVVAPGKLATRAPVIVMQPFTTSRILSIAVKPGDHVRKGQLLVSFDPDFARADEAALTQKTGARTAEIERLEAELARAPRFDAGTDPEHRIQAQIFAQDQAQLAADLAVRDRRIGQIEAQRKAASAIVPDLNRQIEMAKKVVGVRQYLLEQKAGAPLDVMNAQNTEIELESRLKNTLGDVEKLEQQRAEAQADRQSFLDKWRSDRSQQLVQARQDMAEAGGTLGKARKMSDFTQMRAPSDGVVLEIADRSVGSVLREAETLVTMVPDSADLYVEANIPSRDVSDVRVGQPVRIKLEAYPFQRFGTLDGVLDVVSADALPLKKGETTEMVYRAQVRLAGGAAQAAARGFRLKPGLVVSAEVKVGKRSIASYVLSPVLRTVDESMREP